MQGILKDGAAAAFEGLDHNVTGNDPMQGILKVGDAAAALRAVTDVTGNDPMQGILKAAVERNLANVVGGLQGTIRCKGY